MTSRWLPLRSGDREASTSGAQPVTTPASARVAAAVRVRRARTVEYDRRFYYCCSPSHTQQFIAQPQQHLSSAALPPQPQRPYLLCSSAAALQLQKKIEAKHCALLGYCAVTIVDSAAAGTVKVAKGDERYSVVYSGRVFRLAGKREAA